MATELQHFMVPTGGGGTWAKSGPQPAASKAAAKDTMFVVLASGPSLTAAAVDIKALRTMDFGDFAELAAGGAGEGFDLYTRELLGHVRVAHIEPMVAPSAENLRDQTAQFSAALGAFGKLAPEKIFQ